MNKDHLDDTEENTEGTERKRDIPNDDYEETDEAAETGRQGKASFHPDSTTQGGSDFGQGSSQLGGESYHQGDTKNKGSNYGNEERLGNSDMDGE